MLISKPLLQGRSLRALAAAAASALALILWLAVPASASAAYPVPYGNEALFDFVIHELFLPTSVEGANNGCKPTAEHPYPVVLVHGTLEDEGSNWVTVAPLLANNGYCVYAFNYGETALSFGGRVDGLNHIAHSAEELKAFVNKVLAETGASQVDIVGHSQGGMMPNYYIHFLGGASKVHELIGLAPSNHGTTLDGLVTLLNALPGGGFFTTAFAELLQAPALVEQEVGSPFMQELFGSGEPLAPNVRYVVIETSHDEVVTPFTNAFLHGPNVTNILIQEQCPTDPTGHIGMIEDSPALQNMLNQLSNNPNPNFHARCENFGASI
jgi:triacylglycerol esterase/lipase EstA (alpha/beta hydrolase family)